MDGPQVDYRALFEATPTPCLVLHTTLRIVEVNAAYCRVTGRSRTELFGRHLLDAFPPASRRRRAGTASRHPCSGR